MLRGGYVQGQREAIARACPHVIEHAHPALWPGCANWRRSETIAAWLLEHHRRGVLGRLLALLPAERDEGYRRTVNGRRPTVGALRAW